MVATDVQRPVGENIIAVNYYRRFSHSRREVYRTEFRVSNSRDYIDGPNLGTARAEDVLAGKNDENISSQSYG